MWRQLAVAIAFAAATPGEAFAYRPFDQTDADTAEEHTIELELGPFRLDRGHGRTEYEPGFVFNYGFAAGWELVVDVDDFSPLVRRADSYVQTDVLAKHVLRAGSLQEKSGPSVAIELGPLLPTVPQLSDEAGWSTAVIVSQRWEPLTVHVNAQLELTRDRDVELVGGAIVEGPDRWRVRPVAEGYIERENGVNLESGLVGAIWRDRKTLSFDAAVRVFRESGATTGEVRVGLTLVLPT